MEQGRYADLARGFVSASDELAIQPLVEIDLLRDTVAEMMERRMRA